MGKWESPESQIGCRVWDSSQSKLNSLNHLMNEHFSKSVITIIIRAHLLDLIVQWPHLIGSNLHDLFRRHVSPATIILVDSFVLYLVIILIDCLELNAFVLVNVWVSLALNETRFGAKHNKDEENGDDNQGEAESVLRVVQVNVRSSV